MLKKTLKLKFHKVKSAKIVEHRKFSARSRPSQDQEAKKIEYQIQTEIERDEEKVKTYLDEEPCFIIGTNTKADEHSQEIIFTEK